jgi:hypothetical protein
VLGPPLTFALSQDQTLHRKFSIPLLVNPMQCIEPLNQGFITIICFDPKVVAAREPKTTSLARYSVFRDRHSSVRRGRKDYFSLLLPSRVAFATFRCAGGLSWAPSAGGAVEGAVKYHSRSGREVARRFFSLHRLNHTKSSAKFGALFRRRARVAENRTARLPKSVTQRARRACEIAATSGFSPADRHRGRRDCPASPCHTTRHAGPHRAVQVVVRFAKGFHRRGSPGPASTSLLRPRLTSRSALASVALSGARRDLPG